MTALLPAWPLLSAFLVASFVLAITPGPGVFYIVARSLAQGRRSGLASVAGVALGNLGNAVGASLGLAALFAVSTAAFTVVKYAGAAYLVWLGIQALRSPARQSVGAVVARSPHAKVFRDGFIVALLNPKTALFFAAFLPQFMNPVSAPAAQSVLLGVTFVAIAALTDTCYALAAGSLAGLVTKAGSGKSVAQTTGRLLSAAAYCGLGVWTALAGGRPRQ